MSLFESHQFEEDAKMLKVLKNFLRQELDHHDEESRIWTRPLLNCPISVPEAEVQLPFIGSDTKKVMVCCGGNYLGIGDIENGRDVNVGGSPLISGHSNAHVQLENTIGSIYGGKPLIFHNVTLAAQGLLQAITRPLHKSSKGRIIDVILYDSLNHSCLMESLRIADVEFRKAYRHGDMEHLERLLKRYAGKGYATLILTDGVFSMEGDVAPLDSIVTLAKKYGAAVIVDDAHATGVLGKTGKGTSEHFGLEGDDEPIQIVSFSKALGAIGSAIIVDEELSRFLVRNCRNYIFCGTLSPMNAAMSERKISQAFSEPEHRTRLMKNSAYMRKSLIEAGFRVKGDMSILPVYIGDNRKAMAMCRDLFIDYAIYCRAIIYPVVPESLLRFTLTAAHTEDHIEKIIDSLIKLGRKYGITDVYSDNKAVA